MNPVLLKLQHKSLHQTSLHQDGGRIVALADASVFLIEMLLYTTFLTSDPNPETQNLRYLSAINLGPAEICHRQIIQVLLESNADQELLRPHRKTLTPNRQMVVYAGLVGAGQNRPNAGGS